MGVAMAGDPRKELVARIALMRQSVDPALLERARLAAEGKVPYDRATAEQAVRHFLANRKDATAFKQKLVAALKRFDADGK